MLPRWSRIWMTQPRSPWLTLAIAKKTLDENGFRNAQKTMDRKPPSFQLDDRVYFKNTQPGKWDLNWRPGYRIVHIKHNRHYLHIENQATGKTRSCNVKDIVHKQSIGFWHIDMQFSRAGKYNNNPANLPTITLSNWTWTPDSCKHTPVNSLHASSLHHIILN